MKKIVPMIVLILIAVTAYAYGQVNRKPLKNCCCEHTQQIAEDLRWIRQTMSKPYKAPPDIKGIGEFKDPGKVKVPEMKNPKIPDLPKGPGLPKVPAGRIR